MKSARDWIAQKAGGLAASSMGRAFDGPRGFSKVGELRTRVAMVIAGYPGALRELVGQLRASLGKVDPKKPLTPEQHGHWAMLYAVDPAAAEQLRAQHKHLPKLDDNSPLSLDATLTASTSMHLATPRPPMPARRSTRTSRAHRRSSRIASRCSRRSSSRPSSEARRGAPR